MKKRGIIITALTVIAVTVIVLLALAPKHLKGTITCSTSDGETAEVDYDIQYYARHILPSYVKGSLSFNGISYTDSYTKLKDFPYVSDNRLIPSDWWKTKSSAVCNTTFLKTDCADSITAMTDAIRLLEFDCSDGVYRFCFAYTDDGNAYTIDGDSSDGLHIPGIIFYGSAQNAEEAKEIARFFNLQAR